MWSIPSIPDMLSFLICPNRTSAATSLSSGPVAWMTTLSPTFKSFRAAGKPLFWNFVAVVALTVTVFFEVVSTVMDLPEMLVTVPSRVSRFIVSSLWIVGVQIVWDLSAGFAVQELLLPLLLLSLVLALGIERFHLAFFHWRKLR